MDESGDVAMSEGESWRLVRIWGLTFQHRAYGDLTEKTSPRHMRQGVSRSRAMAAAGGGAEEMLRSRELLLWPFVCCETLAMFLKVSKSQVSFLLLWDDDMRCHESVDLAAEDSKFEASLDYIGKHCQRKKKKEERKGGKEERKGRREELREKGREEN